MLNFQIRALFALLFFPLFTAQATLWTPSEISTAMWLDADDFSTVTADGGNLVAQWNDKSGNDRHVSEATHQPTYNPSGWSNGRAHIAFDIYNGASRAHTLGRDVSGDGISGSAYTLFLVLNARQAPGDNEGWPHTARDINGKENRFQINANGVRVRSDASNGGSTSGAFVAGEQILQFTLDSVSSSVWRNGAMIAGNSGTFSPAALTGDFTINGRNSGDGHAGTEGDFAEWIYLTYNPDLDTRQTIEGYLAHKWGLEGSLAGDHPYKNAAPMLIPEPDALALIVVGGLSLVGLRNFRRSGFSRE